MGTTYKLNYILGENVINPSPKEYLVGERTALGIPLRQGYRFVGWTGEELTAPTAKVILPENATGDRTYTAVWEMIPEPLREVDTRYCGMDDGLLPKEEHSLSVPEEKGERGENVYIAKTVYTEILVDGVRDAAYDYGIHLAGELPSDVGLHEENPSRLELWMVRGQDGRAYVYAEVTDSDIVTNEEMFAYKPHHCDSVHFYVEHGSGGSYAAPLGLFIASEEAPYTTKLPRNSVLRRTPFGFAFELAFDNRGVPFMEGDEIGFAFYYNNSNGYKSTKDYKHLIVKLPSGNNPVGDCFRMPLAKDNDTLRFSVESASGRVKLHSEVPSRTGDLLVDACSGAATVEIRYEPLASAHTVLTARRLRSILTFGGTQASVQRETADSPSDADVQILCGRTAAEENRRLCGEMPYHGFGLSFVGNRILLSGWKEGAMQMAEGLLKSAVAYIRAGGSREDLADTYLGTLSGVPGEEIPRLDDLSAVYDAGGSSYLLLSQNSTVSAFEDYCRRLKDAGFALVAENRMVSVRAATYLSDTAVVNVTFGDAEGDRSLRVVVDARAETAIPPNAVEAEAPICQSEIIQLAPARVGWMCYAVRQSNGEFFVIDAGGNGATKYLHDTLLELNGGRHVVISAILFTHFHCDHIGGFLDLMEKEEFRRDVTVKSVIHNFPQKQVLDTASPGDQRNLARWPNVLRLSGATVYLARTGQKYRFGNVELEMLFTFEDLQPFPIFGDRTNPTSHIFSMTVDGQRFLMTGDACGEASRLVVLRYGDALSSDFVQLPHHGHGDGGTAPEFYRSIRARWVLWPGVERIRLPAPEQWACDHAESYFRNDFENTVLSLPYTGKEE